jgi:hypothetical protein
MPLIGHFKYRQRFNLAFADNGRIDIEMGVQKPIFCVVLSDGNHWSLEAEWPDGTIEQVNTFKDHAKAVDWLTTRSEAWLVSRSAFGGSEA